MMRPHSSRPGISSILDFSIHKRMVQQLAALLALVLAPFLGFAQESQPSEPDSQSAQRQANLPTTTVTIPAGTRFALVLTHPIQSRYIHRGDDIYAQITSPVDYENVLVIPPGTFVQGKVDKLERRGGRAELHLQSMSITFPDGYVAPVAGPINLESGDGYALKDPGQGRIFSTLVLPAAGAGLGALIGHSVGKADSTTTSPFPPGCVGAPPFCTTVSTPVFGTKGRDTVIGAGIGAAVGSVASFALLFGSRHFFIDVGAPVEMTLQRPLTLQRNEAMAPLVQPNQQVVGEQSDAPN